ncbi:MAG: alpha/beta hydrolase fold domain-containing protein [Gemmobacter sp.]|nr:alpha/beta hydrolase fold domain-containing protein [Gemmobacter sp.]
MSLRLEGLRLFLRAVVRPRLARTVEPGAARRDFLRGAALLPAPPFLLCLPGPIGHRITAGPVREDAVILWFQGGAYVAGAPATHTAMLGRLSRLSRLAVVAPDYRKAPEHPAPAAFEDAVAAHAGLIAQGWAPGQIVLGGDSAGGGLALALLADLCARGLWPAAVITFSPWTDLTLGGASLRQFARTDPLLPAERLAEAVALVRGALDLADPRLSPLFARFDSPPPVLIQVGSDEILLDDARRMAARLQAAGGAVTLQDIRRAPHVWQMFDGYIPEARAALRAAARFAVDHAGAPVTSR